MHESGLAGLTSQMSNLTTQLDQGLMSMSSAIAQMGVRFAIRDERTQEWLMDGWRLQQDGDGIFRRDYIQHLVSALYFWDQDRQQISLPSIGFEQFIGQQDGPELLRAFVDVVERFSLQRNITSITTDNGSNVLSMMKL